jgi:hemolysin activation/secretion protein
MQRNRVVRALGTLLLAFAIIQAPAYGEDDGPRFPVTGFLVDGNSLLTKAQVEQTLAPFTGTGRSFDTLRQAVEALENAYVNAGYGAIRVVLPAQELDQGLVKLQVFESRIGRVTVRGNSKFSEENILRSVPSLRPGDYLHQDEVTASLALANESFAKQTRLVVSRGQRENEADVQLAVTDQVPWRAVISLDNTGNDATGRNRIAVSFQHANVFDRDHSFSAQYTTSPTKRDKVSVVGFGYRIPFYERGDALEFSWGRSNVNSGTVNTAAGDYAISGRGEFASARYWYGLPRWQGQAQQLFISMEKHKYESQVIPAGGTTSLIPDLSSAPVGLGYSLNGNNDTQTWRASLDYLFNIPGGDTNSTAAYNQPGARPGSDAHFSLWRYQASTQKALGNGWGLALELQGQYTNDMLISGEQFGIGGRGTIRGFNEREISGDRGFRASAELSAPALALPFERSQARFVGFYDFGATQRLHALPGEQAKEGVSSAGIGLRIADSRNYQLRADLARVLDGGGNKRNGDMTTHVQLVFLF